MKKISENTYLSNELYLKLKLEQLRNEKNEEVINKEISRYDIIEALSKLDNDNYIFMAENGKQLKISKIHFDTLPMENIVEKLYNFYFFNIDFTRCYISKTETDGISDDEFENYLK